MAETNYFTNASLTDEDVIVTRGVNAEQAQIVTPGALRFVAHLFRRFDRQRSELLKLRAIRQREIDAGKFPSFREETRGIRESDWDVAPVPEDLKNRRVEVVGVADRKKIIETLNSSAVLCVGDFEDASSPTWHNVVQGQVNLRDAVRGTCTYTSAAGEVFSLGENPGTLAVRPRAWHSIEKHVLVDGEPVSGGLFDFGLYFYHNVQTLTDNGTGAYFYLPKIESHLEARLWNEVFDEAEARLGVFRGAIRATVLIETVLAAFEMDEILYELREHSAGLAYNRWNYAFSFAKRFRNHAQFTLPDRFSITMGRQFLSSYVELLTKTCHRRGVYGVWGMTSPDSAANHDAEASAEQLLVVPDGPITESGLRSNVNVGIRYLESWLRGEGCVTIDNVTEDAASAETSRAQVWQWIKHGATLDDGRTVTTALARETIAEELAGLRLGLDPETYQASRYEMAAHLFEAMITSEEFPEFMLQVAYDYID